MYWNKAKSVDGHCYFECSTKLSTKTQNSHKIVQCRSKRLYLEDCSGSTVCDNDKCHWSVIFHSV